MAHTHRGSRGGGSPRKCGSTCAVCFLKPFLYLRPNYAIPPPPPSKGGPHSGGEGAPPKVKSESSQGAHTAGAYPGFCSIYQLGELLLPSGRDTCPLQGYCPPPPPPNIKFASTHSYTWVEKGAKVSCPRTQHNDPTRTLPRSSAGYLIIMLPVTLVIAITLRQTS